MSSPQSPGGRLNVSAYSIRNPLPAVVLFVLMTVLGFMGFHAMKVQTFPDIELPTIVVRAALPGAAPAQLESEVAVRIENALATLDRIKHISTRIQDGVVLIAAEFQLEKPSQEALDGVRDAVSRVRADLPPALLDPVVTRLNLGGTPILAYSVSSGRLDEQQLSWLVDGTLSPALLKVKGVGSVTRVGGVDRQVLVELDPAKLLALQVSAADISRQLRQVQQESGSGRADIGGARQTIRTTATVATAAELAALEITLPDGRRLRLGDVASVQDTVAEPSSIALLDGKPVVGFEVTRAEGAGEVEVAQQLRAALDRLRVQYPDLQITEAFNRVDAVQENYSGSMLLLYEGCFLAVVVVLLFLRDGRATLISATALPLSILPTFALMHFGFGLTLNLVTLLSLSLVVGVLVDDAIVEVENIERHLRMGKTPYQAAMEAADEIGLAVIATTVTLVAVFLPTAFLAGVPGRFFVHFGITASIAVVFSTVVARMLTPMMCAYLMKVPQQPARPVRWMPPYLRAARWCLQHRALTVVATVLFSVAALALAPLLPSGFIPPDDLSQTQVRLRLQPGSTLAQTHAAAEHARVLVQQHPAVRTVYATVGGGSTGSDPLAAALGGDVAAASLNIVLIPRDERPGQSKSDIEAELRRLLQDLPHARVQVGIGGSGESFTLLVSGDRESALVAHARQIETDLRGLPGLGAVVASTSLQRQDLVVRPDPVRAAAQGVTTAAISEVLRVATVGDFDQALPRLNLSERQLPVVVRLPVQLRDDLDWLARLPVPGARGAVPLGSVADIALENGPTQIERYDRRRNVRIEAETGRRTLGEVQREAFGLASVRQPPTGIEVRGIGDAEAMQELFSSFAVAMATGVLCIYLVLVLLFRDVVQPVTILGALVLTVPGALVTLFLTQSSLSMPSLIGLIMLMGVATKNSILIVDYAIMARRQGMGRTEAVLDACSKRARPIVMTSVAMAAGMLPIAMGIGVDPSFRAPMALVVIGGMVSSTVLSLLVIPVLFTLLDDLRLTVVGRFTRAAAPAR